MTALAYRETDQRIVVSLAQQRANHRAFREKIAARAAALAESKRPKPKPLAILPETDPPRPLAYPSVASIQKEVAAYFGIAIIDLKSQRRGAEVVLPRQVAMYLCKYLTPHSLPALGRHFGGRDHTTVLHAVRKIDGLVWSDVGLAYDVAHLLFTITGEWA